MSRFRYRARRLAAGLSFTLVLIVAAAGVRAASTGFWLVASQTDFLKGEPNQISIDSDGRVTLGPALETVKDVGAPAVWRLAPDDREGLWAATGSDGKLWHVDARGEAKAVFDAAELDLHAVAAGPGGAVFAGSSPDGKVYRITSSGASSVLFDPEEKYIWALAAAPDGTLFVGTGSKGRIYRVGADGRGTLFYDPEAEHVSALVIDASGQLVVGTSSPGRVVRLDAAGKPFVLLESAYKEVRSLDLAAGGVIYATAAGSVGGTDATPARPVDTSAPTPVPTMSTEITVSAIGDATIVTPGTSGSGGESRSGSGAHKGAVYRIAPDGDWSVIWESPEDLPYDVLVEPSGALLVATGAKGKLYRLTGNPTLVTLVTRIDAQQVTALARDRSGRVLLATSNPGRILRVTAGTAATGTYVSDVRDTTTVATWGAIRWRGVQPAGTRIELFTRSGNTRTPDKTWSDWSSAYTTALGTPIASPKARYLQWKAVLSGTASASPALTSVTAAYLPRNTRPSVDSITVHPPGVAFQRPFPTGDPELAGFDTPDARPGSASATSGITTPLGRRTYQKSLQTIAWQARDGDSDRLTFDVLYRLEGETSWKALKRGLTDEIYTWDTTTVPDGTYFVKIVASDVSANAPDFALQGERESSSFDVDNTPPVIDVPRGTPPASRVAFTVRDTQSPILRVEYSHNAGRWKLAYPVDGLLDAREERFELTLEGEGTGPVVLRVTDALGNLATTVVPR
jgi:hypothetical protein